MVILKSILLSLHLILVNLAAIGPLFCLALIYRTSREAGQTARWLTRQCCLALLVGMLLGGTIMGFYSLGGTALDGKRFYQALLSIPHDRLWWGVAELAFYYLCMLPIVFFWQPLSRRRWLIALLCFLAATNLIYHFTPMFVLVAQLQMAPVAAPLSGSELIALYFSPPILARVVHHLLAGFAIVASVLLLRTASQAHRAVSIEARAAFDALTRRGGLWVFVVTLLEIPSGIWFLLSLPSAVQKQLLGGSLWASGGFIAALVLVLLLVQKSLAVALGETARRDAWHLIGLLVLVVLLMTGLLAFLTPS